MLIAALPPAEPPARVVAGVQVTWPLSKPETSLAPGSKLTVRIESKRRRAQVSFIRVNAQGEGLSTVAKRMLRRGSFTVTVPAATRGARYALRLTVAGRKRFSWVTTPVAAPLAPAPAAIAAPTPTATPTPLSFCGPESPPQAHSDINPTVRLTSATVEVSGTLAFSVVNAGPGTFSVATSAALVPDGQISHHFGDFSEPWTRLLPGEEAQRSLVVPADTAPGSYRLAVPSQYASCDTISTWPYLSEPFEVLPG